jgi:WD40 repeat protein
MPILCLLSCSDASNSSFSKVSFSQSPARLFEFGRSDKDCFGNRIFVDPKQPTFFVSYLQRTIRGWDVTKAREAFSWSVSHLNLSEIFDGAILPDGAQMLLVGATGIYQVNLWDGSKIAAYDRSDASFTSYFAVGVRDDGKLAAATALTDDSKLIPNPMMFSFSPTWNAQREQNQKIVLLDLESKKIISSLNFKDSFVHSVKFSANHKFLVTTSYLSIRFWDISDPLNIALTKEINVKDIAPRSHIFMSAATSSDMRLIAVATRDDIFVISTESGLIIPTTHWKQQGEAPPIIYLQWSASNQEVMGSNLQGRIYIWSINDTDRTYVGEYNKGPSVDTFIDNRNSRVPYLAFAIDPFRRFFIRPGQIHEPAARQTSCSGMEVMKLPDMTRSEGGGN